MRKMLSSLVLLGLVCLPSIAHAQTLDVSPSRVLLDEVAVIRAAGLQPHERISIEAALVDGAGQTWASQADFKADAQGNVDVSKQAPVAGSYKEVSAMGLIWSMRPTTKNVSTYRPPQNLALQSIQFRLLKNGAQVTTAQLEQLHVAEGVRRTRLTGELHGTMFVPNTPGRHPAVLVLGGSEGGVPTLKAAWLASHGFAAVALAYFRFEDLPPLLEAIPLEYFGRAMNWMMNQPEIQPDQIAVLGTSRGGELALQLGSMYPQIRAVVAYVPANVRYPACCGNNRVPYAWTWQGQPLGFTRPRFNVVPESAIRVEQTRGPVLMISGQDDGVWQSSSMADAVVSRLKDAHFAYPVQHLKYSHAGHMAGLPEIVPAWHGTQRNPTSGREVDPGGTIAGNAQSSIEASPKVIEFLQRTLKN